MTAARIFVCAACILCAASAAAARERRHAEGRGVPALDVRGSCMDAQKFSSAGSDKNVAFKGCLQDEMNAKAQLAKRWSSFKSKDRQNCVEQARAPSPSYVEVLTCLEMDSDAMSSTPRFEGKPVPQIGGPAAPGLSNDPAAMPK